MNSRRKTRLFFLTGTISGLIAFSGFFLFTQKPYNAKTGYIESYIAPTLFSTPTPTPIETPPAKLLSNDYQIFQTFNNCGPAALSMALSYYGITASQETLGQSLRPYQNIQGDNDDKSVTLDELAEESKKYNLIPYHRPNGDIKIIKQFITLNIPIITRTWLKVDEDIGHYRVIKGYDDTRHVIIQDDSLQGRNLEYSYDEFNTIWKKFNYEYLVLVPKEKEELAKSILGNDVNPKIAWQKAIKNAQAELSKNPNDMYSQFNLAVAYYNTGNYKQAIETYEKVENALPSRTLWYQIEPLEAYYFDKNYEKVLSISEHILNNQNRAYSELYILRGKIFQEQGNTEAARQEFEKAVFYNQNLKSAQEALQSL